MVWIDYRKAYDFVPHSWILECLDMHEEVETSFEFEWVKFM